MNDSLLLLPPPEPIQVQYKTNWLGLHPFKPTKPFQIFCLCSSIPTNIIQLLIEEVKMTTTFTLHTSNYNKSTKDAFIFIELIQVGELQSKILLFQINRLLSIHHGLRFDINTLLQNIFLPTNKIYTWNKNKKDLYPLIHISFFSKEIFNNLSNLIPLQKPFKQWYNKTFTHDNKCPCSSRFDNDNDYPCCICPYRPCKHIDEQWTLHRAINCVLNEFIPQEIKSITDHQDTITIYTHYCLATTKLAMIIELDWKAEQVYQYNKYH
ncbi:unnamed protein product [Adineta steineri]|uniref:Uncharacterized protein n=1 Tax=Adineta steineri TaxID=433720 RepID=A0A813SXX8_9BILA|nr:unnamed protein product [Adineta steineri]CAF3921857.1 unnamed protein product [Adineta steineri]